MFTIQRYSFTLRLMTAFVAICSLFSSAQAQEQTQVKPSASSPSVTANATAERVRFAAPNAVAQLRLEVYNGAGQKIFDTEMRGGTVVDWHLQDGEGQRVTSGAYACLLTVRSLSGRISQKLGLVTVDEKTAAVRQVEAAELTPQQAQAVGPLEGQTALVVLRENEAPAATAVTHDGIDGQLARTRGALSFRMGDFFSGTDVEQMRLTEEGNLGIGTDKPEVRLDVNGMIRARQGFQFADGSVLNLAPTGGGLRVTLPSGETARVSFAPTAVDATAHRIPKFAADGSTLQDSNIYQDPTTGNIGIGTTTPQQHPFVVRRNGGNLGVHNLGELFVDRDDRTRSASLTVGTAGTLKWIFGMPYQSDGFQVYDLTNNVSRFFVDPTSGGIGLGTTTPRTDFRLDVSGRALIRPGGSGEMQFGTPSGETGMTILATNTANMTNRADVRYDGTTLKLLNGAGTAPPAGGIAIHTDGRVGIGTFDPSGVGVLAVRAQSTGLGLTVFQVESANGTLFSVNDGGLVFARLDPIPSSIRVCQYIGYLSECSAAIAAYVPTLTSASDPLEAGDMVSLAPPTGSLPADSQHPFAAVKSTTACDQNLLGVISDLKLGADGKKVNDSYLPLARSGNFPVKVTTENGAIRRGDPITSSSKPGYGMKATEACRIIGYALEDADREGKIQVLSQAGENAAPVLRALRAQVERLEREREREVNALKSENAEMKARLEVLERAVTVEAVKRP